MLFINADYGYTTVESTGITKEEWAEFVVDAIDELVTRMVSYKRPPPKKSIEDHIKMFGLSAIQNAEIDSVLDDMGQIITDLTSKFDGYTELSVIKHHNGYAISALTDHRIAEWYRGRGKPEPTDVAIDYHAKAFNNALRASTFGRAHTTVSSGVMVTKPVGCSSPNIRTYVDVNTAFVDGHNMKACKIRGVEVIGAVTGDALYEVCGEGVNIYGNWYGAGDVWCPMDGGEIFEIVLDKTTMRPVLRIL